MNASDADPRVPTSDRCPSPPELMTRLQQYVSVLLGLPEPSVDLQAPLSDLAFTSLQVTALSGVLEEWTGRKVPTSLFWESSTLAGVVARLCGGQEAAGRSPAAPAPGAGVRRNRTPVAIIGIGCRLPGASSPDALWNLLAEGRTTADGLELRAADGTRTRLEGSFLADVDSFDARFFGISPREAASMDPQQRLLMETAWEALEDANQVPGALAGSSTGVFVGISGYDHGRLHYGSERADLHTGTGSALSIAANRLSYTFDFTGPSLSVDTACSSSLVAVHLACRSLWEGETELALAGGVNVILDGAVNTAFQRAGFLSPDGRCKAFDASADGYGRGEGSVVVVLKPLDRALEDGDPIHALIRGTAINQDGRSNGLTAPNGAAQERLVAAACRHAGIEPAAVGYIEAHGTGTALGDPVEARALGRVLRVGRSDDRPCLVGSVKSNLGHLEAAAGIAGLVKTALCVQRREIPPNAGYHTPNPEIDFDALGLSVADAHTPWPAAYDEAVAGVSAFGFGGTNAHIVLSEPPRDPFEGSPEGSGSATLLLPVSGTDARDTGRTAEAYRRVLEEAPGKLGALAHTAGALRTHHRHRRALVVSGVQHARQLLDEAAVDLAPAPSGGLGRIAFVFSGQGNQWPGMGRELLRDEPIAARVLGECDEAIGKLTGWSLFGTLASDEIADRLEDPAVLQPVLVSLQMAMARTVESWGIRPEACVGHSLGEVSAAAVTGALDIEEALFLAVTRGELMRQATGTGRTALLGLPADEASARIERAGGQADIAAWNAPRSTLIAGAADTVRAAVEACAAEGVFARVLPGTTAFHSRYVEPLRDRLAELMDGLAPQDSAAAFISTVTGSPVDGRSLDATYWGRNLREPVRFTQAVRRLVDDGYRTFIEIGAHPTLTPAVLSTAAQAETRITVLPTGRRDEPERGSLLHTLGALYEAGAEVDFAAVNPAGADRVALPVRQWHGERFGDRRTLAAAVPATPSGLLGRRLSVASGAAHYWEGTLSPNTAVAGSATSGRYLLHGTPLLLPDTFASAALDAVGEVLSTENALVPNVRTVGDTGRLAQDCETQLAVTPGGPGVLIALHTRPKGTESWSLAATASATVSQDPSLVSARTDLEAARRRCARSTSGEELRAALRGAGLEVPYPDRIVSVHHGVREAFVELRLPTGDRRTLLDAMMLAAVLVGSRTDDERGVGLPARLAGVFSVGRTDPGAGVWAQVRLLEGEEGEEAGRSAVTVGLFAADGRQLAGMERVVLAPLDAAETAAADALHRQDTTADTAVGIDVGHLLAAERDERAALLTEHLCRETARVLRTPVASIDAEAPMNALGLDSIMGFELHCRLEAELGIEVPVVRFLRGASARQMATELAEALEERPDRGTDGLAPTTEPADLKHIEELLATLDDLPDEEVDSLLQRFSAQAAEPS
ncbi:acyltransferase domain-containing protein [Streptomyces sp. RPA4-5]|uniref:type I polyketide synthase n=1 Tax=Streptomyces sp. RPA4-5 TaxID=2721245 RepID=UPI00143E82C6|nr:type I polyketide synthase [Streptomyces sp. RPA4-5]QIY54447.1 acyltransferase domain-containing protein [Streptomyces sp. RPA4-5]